MHCHIPRYLMKKFHKSTNQKTLLQVNYTNTFQGQLFFQWLWRKWPAISSELMILSNYKSFGKFVPWESKEVVNSKPLAARYYALYCSPSMFHLTWLCLWCNTHRAIAVPWYEASEQISHELKAFKPHSFLASMTDVIHIRLFSMSTKRKFWYTE